MSFPHVCSGALNRVAQGGGLLLGCWVIAACWAADLSAAEEPMPTQETATFAGGCFWCMEPPFEKLDGVSAVTSGYTGGTEPNPTYEQVSSGATGYAEAVQVVYEPSKVTYERLLEVFWMNIDPTTPNRQFADSGSQYRTAIFYHTDEQQRLAEASRVALARSGKFDKPIVTEIAPAGRFYPAEDYHQDYYKKNPLRYKLYRIGSGREGFLNRVWGPEASHE
jgi:methionine-S-sulfoxide reductase